MIVRKLRLQRGWSQDQLAQMSGLNIRTIQRIERGQNAGLESLKSLAAVFEVQVATLQQETDEASTITEARHYSESEAKIIEHVRDIKDFYNHLISYITVVVGLFVINLIMTNEYIWAKWTAIGWGIGVIAHGLSVFEIFNFFGPRWERNEIKKRLGRKL